MDELRATVESIFRRESGRIIASLIRVSRSFDLAEEAMQDAFAAALSHWSTGGMPANPSAWITAAAHRKLIDYARREQTRRNRQEQLRYETKDTVSDPQAEGDMSATWEDDRLRLIFTCCHPALNEGAQIALTLRTLGGLTTTEIAHAFLLPEQTLAQRLVRAKRKIEQARIPYVVPVKSTLPERLRSVRAVLYLIFNEGYSASSGDNLIRRELCAEAIRLTRTLCELMPAVPENEGLLGLMLLHDSRRDTRVNSKGELVTLEEQDRTLWDRAEIEEGLRLTQLALSRHNPGPYQVQAAIAAVHAESSTAAQTDWRQIAALYKELMIRQPSATVFLNHAAAVGMADGPEQGLVLLDGLSESGALDSYHLYYAARADLLRRLSRREEALIEYQRALSLTANAVERRYLRRRMNELGALHNTI
ncbi:MAG TPA: RNA polymerase sigma factor [Bryobacteraceae bacterium]|nr:RNA polymerase sigma factor [Bryobacteraceae bacterium]